jgi:hypothetical protein
MGVEKPMRNFGSKLSAIGKQRPGMALPLVILLVIVGFVFVGVGAYVVQNLFWSSQGVVIESKLYNAAQSGIEWGMALIWENKDNIEADLITSVDSLDDLRARMDNLGSGVGTDYLDDEKALPETDSNITLTVTVLDCNYSLATGATITNLPPRVLAGTGSGGTGTPAIPPGTSVIIDPSHFLPLGGGVTSHSFVIRSRATGFGRSTELESMVVIEK